MFTDTDGDGICDNQDCSEGNGLIVGDPCDDGNPCTYNDIVKEDCMCEGQALEYGLSVDIEGDLYWCYEQTNTILNADIYGGTEPYTFIWSNGESTESIVITEISQGGGDVYSVTVTDKTGCTEESSVELIFSESGDFDGDGYCDDLDCAPYSADLGGPGSPCDDGDPHTINDVHDENCDCVGIPNPCNGTDNDGDGICEECQDEFAGGGNPNAMPSPCFEDCDDNDPTVGGIGSPCDDENPFTINDRMNENCNCVGEISQDNICLMEVWFMGEFQTNYIPIAKDDGTGIYTAPQFISSEINGCSTVNQETETRKPIAYVSGTKAKVQAVFESELDFVCKIRGIGPEISTGKIIFPTQTCSPIDGIITYNSTEATDPFLSDKIKYWEEFLITW